jgi:hypothetical protein
MEGPMRFSLLFVLLLSAAGPLAGESVYVLDREARSVAALDGDSLAPSASAALPFPPDTGVVLAGGKRLLVLSWGSGKEKNDGFVPSGPGAAVLLESGKLKEIARSELGWGRGFLFRSPDGQAAGLFFPGSEAAKGEPAHAGELAVVDAAKGTIRRIQFSRAASDAVSLGDGKAVVLLPPGGAAGAATELLFVDLATGGTEPTAISGTAKALFLAPSGRTIWIQDPGPGKSSPGRMLELSVAEKKVVAEHTVGASARALGFDRRERLLAWSAKAGTVKEPSLFAFAPGAAPTVLAGVRGAESFRYSTDGSELWLAGGGEVARVALGETLAVAGKTRINGDVFGFDVTADGNRVLSGHPDGTICCRVVVADVPSGKKLDSFWTGSYGRRLGKTLPSALFSFASYVGAERSARATGQRSFTWTLYSPVSGVPQHGAVFLRRDGKVGYVLNPCTDEVTVMETEPPKKIDNLDAGKKVNEIVRLPAGDLVVVLSESGARVFDMATNAVVSDAPTSGGPARIAFSADGSRFWISGDGAVHVLDGKSGKVLATSKAFQRPAEVLVAR